MNKQYLNEKLVQGFTFKEIACDFGCLLTKVRYWVKKHGLLANNNNRTWSDEQMKNAISESFTISDALRKIGLTTRAGNFDTVKRFIKENQIDISHLKGRGWHSKIGQKISSRRHEDKLILLRENSPMLRTDLKKYLLDSGKLINECSICSCGGLWCGKPMNMVLDHINGVNYDHRIENLRMLCPNCNSQQSTFCRGRFFSPLNVKEERKCSECGGDVHYKTKTYICSKCNGIKQRKVPRPSKEELEKLVSENSLVALGKMFGVSDNAIRKWMRQYGIENSK